MHVDKKKTFYTAPSVMTSPPLRLPQSDPQQTKQSTLTTTDNKHNNSSATTATRTHPGSLHAAPGADAVRDLREGVVHLRLRGAAEGNRLGRRFSGLEVPLDRSDLRLALDLQKMKMTGWGGRHIEY